MFTLATSANASATNSILCFWNAIYKGNHTFCKCTSILRSQLCSMIWSLCALCVLFAIAEASTCKPSVVSCYYGTWAIYNQGKGKFTPEDIDPCVCTHLIYTFMGISDSGEVHELDPWMDDDPDGEKGIQRTLALKKKNPELKIMYAIGGWNEGSEKYSSMVNNPSKLQRFVETAVKFAEKHHFDGVDVDWEYPGKRGGVSSDKEGFTKMLQQLSSELHKKGLILSIAVGAAPDLPETAYDVPAISKHVDLIHLMTYDLHGPWDSYTGANSAIYNDPQGLDMNKTILLWKNSGVDMSKLILGTPAYGHCYNMAGGSKCAFGQTAEGGADGGPYTNEQGTMGYHEMCESQMKGGWENHYDTATQTPYACKGNVFCSYDDPKSMTLKAQFAQEMCLGGVMVWSVDTDDFRGTCHGLKFPLMHAINDVLNLKICNGYTTPSTTTTTGSDSSSDTPPTEETTPTTTPASVDNPDALCKKPGYIRDPKNCQVFYECVQNQNSYKAFHFQCGDGLLFDEEIKACNFANQVKC